MFHLSEVIWDIVYHPWSVFIGPGFEYGETLMSDLGVANIFEWTIILREQLLFSRIQNHTGEEG
jgi:hypothetical protein